LAGCCLISEGGASDHACRVWLVDNFPIVEGVARPSPPVPHFSSVLFDWTATLNDADQHDDKRQHKKKVDKAA